MPWWFYLALAGAFGGGVLTTLGVIYWLLTGIG